MDRNRITKIAIGPAFQNVDTRGEFLTFSVLLDEWSQSFQFTYGHISQGGPNFNKSQPMSR